jgi:hypothetical protein
MSGGSSKHAWCWPAWAVCLSHSIPAHEHSKGVVDFELVELAFA